MTQFFKLVLRCLGFLKLKILLTRKFYKPDKKHKAALFLVVGLLLLKYKIFTFLFILATLRVLVLAVSYSIQLCTVIDSPSFGMAALVGGADSTKINNSSSRLPNIVIPTKQISFTK